MPADFLSIGMSIAGLDKVTGAVLTHRGNHFCLPFFLPVDVRSPFPNKHNQFALSMD